MDFLGFLLNEFYIDIYKRHGVLVYFLTLNCSNRCTSSIMAQSRISLLKSDVLRSLLKMALTSLCLSLQDHWDSVLVLHWYLKSECWRMDCPGKSAPRNHPRLTFSQPVALTPLSQHNSFPWQNVFRPNWDLNQTKATCPRLNSYYFYLNSVSANTCIC